MALFTLDYKGRGNNSIQVPGILQLHAFASIRAKCSGIDRGLPKNGI